MELGLEPGTATASLALCAALSVLAVYVALDLARRVRAVRTHIGLCWLAGAALSLGTGIWSVHVLSLGARALPYVLGYHPLAVIGVCARASTGRRRRC